MRGAPIGLRRGNIAVFGDYLYIVGGVKNSRSGAVRVYRSKDSANWTYTTMKSQASKYMQLAVMAGTLYSMFGQGASEKSDDIWRTADGLYWKKIYSL